MGVTLGVIGSIFGILSSLVVMVLGGTFGHLVGWEDIGSLGFMAMLSSMVGLVGSIKSRENHKYGWLMIIAGIAGFIFNFMAYIIPAVLLISGGVVVLSRR